jgi:hypothetical protein
MKNGSRTSFGQQFEFGFSRGAATGVCQERKPLVPIDFEITTPLANIGRPSGAKTNLCSFMLICG